MQSYEKSQSDKQLSKDLWGVLVILFVGCALAGGSFLLSNLNSDAKRHQAELEVLAYQVLEIHYKDLKTQHRGPASAYFESRGTVGSSSEGAPYSYEIKEEEKSWVVHVWSDPQNSDQTEVRILKEQL